MDSTTTVQPKHSAPAATAAAVARLRVMANLIEADQLPSSGWTYVSVEVTSLDELQRWAAALDVNQVNATHLREAISLHLHQPDTAEFMNAAMVSCRVPRDICPLHGKDCTCGLGGELADAGSAVPR